MNEKMFQDALALVDSHATRQALSALFDLVKAGVAVAAPEAEPVVEQAEQTAVEISKQIEALQAKLAAMQAQQ